MVLLGRAAHRISMPLAHAMPHVHEIEMSIDLNDMDRAMAAEGPDAGNVDGVVTTEDHRHRAAFEDLSDGCLCISMAPGRIGMDDVDVPDVDDAHLVERQINDVVLMIVGATMTERKQGRGFADGSRPEPRTGAVLRTHVEGHAENGDIGVELVPLKADGPFAEGAMPDKWQIQSAALIPVCHASSDPQLSASAE